MDVRILEPRVGGSLVIAASMQLEHATLALPTLHQFVYPTDSMVTYQVVLSGYAGRGSVLHIDHIQEVRMEEAKVRDSLPRPKVKRSLLAIRTPMVPWSHDGYNVVISCELDTLQIIRHRTRWNEYSGHFLG